jgi:hypothetical protein
MVYGIALGFPQNLNPAPNMRTRQELVEIDFVLLVEQCHKPPIWVDGWLVVWNVAGL